jgi:glycosyltransferase involved in cell wall biosynthesis
VELIFNQSNQGFGAACNQAFARARGEMILLLNPDAYLRPGALGKLKKFLVDHPRAAAVSPRAWIDDAQTHLIPPNHLPAPADAVREVVLNAFGPLRTLAGKWRRRRDLRALARTGAHTQAALSGAHMLVRRDAIEKAGGLFDERFFLYFEDSDLCRRLAGAGYRLYVLPDAEAVHNYDRCHADYNKKLEYGGAAAQAYSEKYDPAGRIRRLAGWLKRVFPPAPMPAWEDLGERDKPFQLEVPQRSRSAWALELSRRDDLSPATVYFGSGPQAGFDNAFWSLMPPAEYYLRLGRRGGWRTDGTWRFRRMP